MEKIYEQLNEEKIKSFVKWIYSLSPIEMISVGYIISIILCEYTTVNEQNVIGNFLEMIGQTLLTSNAQATTINPDYIGVSISQLENFKREIFKELKKHSTKRDYNRN